MEKGITISLAGKTALIGGASQGIGWAIAENFAKVGAQCILLARNETVLQQRVNELNQKYEPHHSYLAVDYSDAGLLSSAVSELLNTRVVDILINNTGGPAGGPLINADINLLIQSFQQHVVANQILASLVVPQMKQLGWGRIINVISTSVKVPLKGLGVSNTIRAAVGNWSKTLANELGSSGITVNNVLPGATYTSRLQEIIQNRSTQNQLTEEEVTAQMLKEIPLGRFATPDEVAYAALFLASDLANSINGVNLPVDGGRTPAL